ncbi:NAD-dependent epimerase/dehydratase family protein [Thermomonospora cellulosilytica]|uniref:Nucleoside-diphosphate-sugar epimerase n=1 Tax=Thermomonospora cellulosilytica TaxID=1411118 RepID=A0A7W3MYG3_9ACTN|nr:NAD(P)-dependent oxidoreductase [Thermomonospora cellulosilytica]MBA9004205.1 nucleoside-diphosphate-sugar epimerase [Thermomonospora cellulosilytica]
MSRVLVTGSAGRLGRSVVTSLAAAGHEVIGVDPAPGSPPEAAAVLPADLTDLGEAHSVIARFRPEAVVHLAAIAVPFSRSEATTFRVNTQLAFNVCAACVALGVDRLVVASSPTVIGYGAPGGWTPSYLPLDEDHPTEPWNAYNLSKLVAEQTMKAFARSTETTRMAAFRPCFVVAPEEWEGAPTQTGHTITERLERPELGGTSLFNYLDARDAGDFVDALLAGLARPETNGEVFFAGAADALAREPLAELLPAVMPETKGLASVLTGTAPAFSSAKAERLLGWTAKRSWRTELS